MFKEPEKFLVHLGLSSFTKLDTKESEYNNSKLTCTGWEKVCVIQHILNGLSPAKLMFEEVNPPGAVCLTVILLCVCFCGSLERRHRWCVLSAFLKFASRRGTVLNMSVWDWKMMYALALLHVIIPGSKVNSFVF